MMQGHQPEQGEHETRAITVEDCPRCGQYHGEIHFRRIEQPLTGLGGEYAWWWLCETAKAPVLAQLSWEEA